MRQLEADFRRIYNVSYWDVTTEEAIDLASMLGPGSAYLSAIDPHCGWDATQNLIADLVDSVSRLTHMLSDAHTTEGAQTVVRPGDAEDAKERVGRAARANEIINETEWEEVNV